MHQSIDYLFFNLPYQKQNKLPNQMSVNTNEKTFSAHNFCKSMSSFWINETNVISAFAALAINLIQRNAQDFNNNPYPVSYFMKTVYDFLKTFV